jgi:uncharacterized membrane protein
VKTFLLTYVIVLVVMLFLDGLWLGVMMKGFYAKHLSGLLAKEIVWWAAIVFYLIYALGLTALVVYPLVFTAKCPMRSVWMGGLFGLCAYATYDLTNQATIKNWPVLVTVVDLIWGTFMSAVTCGVSFVIARSLLKIG